MDASAWLCSMHWRSPPHLGQARWPAGTAIGLATRRRTPRPIAGRRSTGGRRAAGGVSASTYRLRSCDVSQGGMKLNCATPLAVGSDVVVTLAGIEPQPGVVRWARDGQMGVELSLEPTEGPPRKITVKEGPIYPVSNEDVAVE